MRENESKQASDELIAGFLMNELTPDEKKELISWIKLNQANKQYFDECCEVWVTAKASMNMPGYRAQEGFWKFKQRTAADKEFKVDSNRTGLFQIILKYAAIIVIAFSLSGVLFYYLGKNHQINHAQSSIELVVPLGSQVQYSFPDGTEVTLNAGSVIKYDNRFGISERTVQLEGECQC